MAQPVCRLVSVCGPLQLVVFDPSGGVRYVQESTLTFDKKHTVATHYFVPFSTSSLPSPCPLKAINLIEHTIGVEASDLLRVGNLLSNRRHHS
jgi:hypothetical protein